MLLPLGKTLHRRSGVETMFHLGQYGAEKWGLHNACGWLGPSTPTYPLDSREKVFPLRDGSPGPRTGEENCRKGLKEQGPPAVREIREGGYSEDHALPWAAHTDARINTPEEHTQMSKYSHMA